MLPARAVSVASTDTWFANKVMSPDGPTVRSDFTVMSCAAILMAPSFARSSCAVSRCRMPVRSSGKAVSSSSPAAMAAT